MRQAKTRKGAARDGFRGLVAVLVREPLQTQDPPTTQTTYESRICLHIVPEIGHISLNKLTQNDLQQFYGQVKKNGRKSHTELYGEGLPDRMVRMCHATCRSALEKAVQGRADSRESSHRL